MFAVMQKNLALIPEKILRSALPGVKGLTVYDASTLARDALGIVAEGLAADAAERLARQLSAAGVPSVVVDEDTLPDLPSSTHTRRVTLQGAQLLFDDAYGATHPYQPDDVVMVAVGKVRGQRTVTEKVKEKAGLDRHTGARKTRTVTKRRQVADTPWIIELFLRVAPGRYALLPHGCLFDALGTRVSHDEAENYRQLVLLLLESLPDATRNLGAAELEATGETVDYPSRHAFDEELTWRLWHDRVNVYRPEKTGAATGGGLRDTTHTSPSRSNSRRAWPEQKADTGQRRTGRFGILLGCAAVGLVLVTAGLRFFPCDPAMGPPHPDTAEQASYLRGITECLKTPWPRHGRAVIVCDGCRPPAQDARETAFRMMVNFGNAADSTKPKIAGAYGAYPLLLHKKLSERFSRGDVKVRMTKAKKLSSVQAARVFEENVISLDPDLVVMDYGMNDRATGLTAARRAWESMIRSAKANGARVILLTPVGSSLSTFVNPNDVLNKHAEQIRELAQEHDVALVDRRAVFAAYYKGENGFALLDLQSHGKHPTPKAVDLTTAELLRWFPY